MVSRSGATIIGGLLFELERSVATTFTYYLFIPTLGAAVGCANWGAVALLVATVVGFVVSLGAIQWLLRFVSTHSFRIFGIYRILVGLLIVALTLFTTVMK